MALVDVETPSGLRFEHHAVRFPRPAVGTLIVVDARVLLLYRHRFITDSWGWEIPAGRVEAGETIAEAAHREAVEETGWAPGPTTAVMSWHPTNGSGDAEFHLERTTSASHLGEPSDPDESERVEWVSLAEIPGLLRDGKIGDGLSVVGLLAEVAGI